MIRIGVDEAGRGPVIGPLVVCAIRVPKEDLKILQNIGVRDSKDITPKLRETISSQLQQLAEERDWMISIVECSPERIDLNKQFSDLNRLEVELFVEAIEQLDCSKNGIIAVDACDTDPERFGNRLNAKLSERWNDWSIQSAHGMDSTDLVTGAASIVAKVHRDKKMKEISTILGLELGSGYPSDSKTISALPLLIEGSQPNDALRWTWSTVNKIWADFHSTPIPRRSEGGGSIAQSTLDDW